MTEITIFGLCQTAGYLAVAFYLMRAARVRSKQQAQQKFRARLDGRRYGLGSEFAR